jgi:hypothetical protein
MMVGGQGTVRVIACLLGALTAGGAAWAAEAVQRRVVGRLRVTGKVESALEPNVWRPLARGAAVEGMYVRTGPKGSAAVLELASGDLIGIAENSLIQIGTGQPVRVHLVQGHTAYRLRPEGGTVIETPRGTLRAPVTQAAASTAAEMGEGVVKLDGGTTTVHGYRGTAELVAKDGQVTTIRSGQVTRLDAESETITVADADTTAGVGAGLPETAAKEGGGAFDWFPSILGLSPGASAALVGGVAVAGAGAGIAAGVSSGGDDSDGGAVGQGSPFRSRCGNPPCGPPCPDPPCPPRGRRPK